MKKDWTYKKLGEVCVGEASNIALNKIADNVGDYPLYGASGYAKSIDFYKQENEYIGIVKDGAGVGRVGIYPAKSSLVGTMQYILPKSDVLLRYLHYVLKGLDLSKLVSGATIPHIYFKDYSKLSIPIPPLSIQRSIVSELDLLHSLIEKKQEQLRALDNLAQSLFYQMFGDPITNPMGWQVKKLGEVGNFARGVSKHRPRNAPELLGGDMPLIQTGDISNSGIYIQQYTQTYSELGVAQSKIWEPGTLCITIAANIGKASILTFKACFPDSIVGFQANHDIAEILYMYFVFSFLQSILEENAPAVAQKNINLQILSQVKIPLPPLSLQQSFAAKVSAIEEQKRFISQSIKDVESLLAQRMDQYFSSLPVSVLPPVVHDGSK